MDPFEDDHIVAQPGARDGGRSCARARSRRSRTRGDERAGAAPRPPKRHDAARFRVDADGLAVARLPAAGRSRQLLPPDSRARATSPGRRSRSSPRTSTRRSTSPGGADQVDAARLLDEGRRRRSRSTTRSPRRQVSANGESWCCARRRRYYVTALAKAYESKKLGTRGRPVRRSSTAWRRARSGARSSPTPGAGTGTSSTTRTCTAATGRRSGRSTAPYVEEIRTRAAAQLGAVGDGRAS